MAAVATKNKPGVVAAGAEMGASSMLSNETHDKGEKLFSFKDEEKSYRIAGSTIGTAVIVGSLSANYGPLAAALGAVIGGLIGFAVARNDSPAHGQ